jgi:hypothetical protein
MAILHARVSCTIVDELGVHTRLIMYFLVDDSDTVADQMTKAFDWLQIIQPLSSGIITSWQYSVYGDASPFAGTPAVGSRVEQTAVFDFVPPGYAGRKFGLPIPAIVNSVLTAGKVDLTNGLITALVNQVTNTNSMFTPADAHWTSLNGGSLSDAYFCFRKRRQQLSRSTMSRNP